MIKYATANCNICMRARISCSTRVGRTGTSAAGQLGAFPAEGCADEEAFVPVATSSASEAAAGVEGWDCTVRYWALRRARRRMKASYSRPTRRRNSRQITRRMTPMQEPANMPLEVMCHCLERKPFGLG